MAQQLTKEQIITLAEEYKALDRWKQVNAWAEKYYGPAAVKVEVEIEYQFNDGDPEYPSISSVVVRGAEGEYVEPDTSFPAFTEDKDYTGYYGYLDDPDSFIMDKKDEELPTTPESAEYDLTKEPSISFPKVVAFDQNESYMVLDYSMLNSTTAPRMF